MRRDGVERAVGADILRLVDIELQRPCGGALPGDDRRLAEIFLGQDFKVVESARNDGADDHPVDLVARVAFELEQLVEPDRILIGRPARVTGDPPARLDLGAVHEGEHQVCVSDVYGQDHGRALEEDAATAKLAAAIGQAPAGIALAGPERLRWRSPDKYGSTRRLAPRRPP